MENNQEYEKYGFSQDLYDIDKNVDSLEVQLDVAINEINKLVELSTAIKYHQSMYKYTWKHHNIERFEKLLQKSKTLDTLLQENF